MTKISTEELERLLEAKNGLHDIACLRAVSHDLARELLAARKVVGAIRGGDPDHFIGNGVIVLSVENWNEITDALTEYDEATQ